MRRAWAYETQTFSLIGGLAGATWYMFAMLAMSLAAALVGPSATANPRLQWEAPPECPDATAARAEIEARTAQAWQDDSLSVVGRVEAVPEGGYRLELQLQTPTGHETRSIEAEHCDALAEATALLVALALEPEPEHSPEGEREIADEASLPPPPESAPTTPRSTATRTDPGPSSVAASTVSPTRSKRRILPVPSVIMALRGGAELGAMPGVAGAVLLDLGVLWRHLRVDVGASYLTPRTERTPSGAVRVQLGAGRVRGCGVLPVGSVAVLGCGGLEVGVALGQGRDLPEPTIGRAWWVAPLLAAGVRWWVHPRIALLVELEGAFPAVRPAFEAGDPDDPDDPVRLFSSLPASGRVSGGLELRLFSPP